MCPLHSQWFYQDQYRRPTYRDCDSYAACSAFFNGSEEPNNFSEDEIAFWFNRLENIASPAHSFHWMCVAHLAEAALLTAGARADQADFRGAGDLLANPRRVNIHFVESSRLVRKKRHMPLSQQFAYPGCNAHETLCRLAKETMLHTQEKALLPALYQCLKRPTSNADAAYLDSLSRRMERVAEVLNFLACDGIFSPDHLQAKLMSLSVPKKTWYKSQLCNFDHNLFWYFGRTVASCLAPKSHFVWQEKECTGSYHSRAGR